MLDSKHADAWFASRRWAAVLFAAVAAAAVLAILTRNLLHHSPGYDELLHILAARGVAETGQPSIAAGIYTRAALYTHAVAWAKNFISDDLIAGRVPAWLGALLLVALVSGWTTRKAGLLAGLAAGLILAIHQWTLDVAVFARFYTLHAVAVFVMFIGLYEAAATGMSMRSRMLYLAIAIISLPLAWHLQVTTAIAAGGVGLGILVGLAIERRELTWRMLQAHPWLIATTLLAALGGTVFVIAHFHMVDTFQSTPLWSAGVSDRLNYYNLALSRDTPLFWPLVPFAALGVCIVRPRLGLTLLTAAAVAFLLHSLAASKAPRYLYYALPFISILLGCGLAMAISFVVNGLANLWVGCRRAAVAVGLAVFGLSAAASQEFYWTLRLAVGKNPHPEINANLDEPDWSIVKAVLAPLAAQADAIVASNAMKSIYYLGRYDYELNVTIVDETDTRRDFGIDERTGGRAIGSAEALAKVIGSHARTLIIVENKKLGIPHGAPKEAIAQADASCSRVQTPAEAEMVVWWCAKS